MRARQPQIRPAWKSARTVVLLLVLAVAYPLAQRFAKQQLGIKLPTLGSLTTGPPAAEQMQPPAAERKGWSESTTLAEQGGNTPEATDRDSTDHSIQPGNSPLPEILQPVDRDVYQLPSGLRFTPGSAEGHRLEHLKRHLIDQPSRAGPHGVFHGDLANVLRLIDEAYRMAQQNRPNVSKKQEGDRTVLEIKFDQAIGYVGGTEGARRGHPKAYRMRLVVLRDLFITAFPF